MSIFNVNLFFNAIIYLVKNGSNSFGGISQKEAESWIINTNDKF